MPKSGRMGRTNVILLVMGILACVILSLLMQRGLKLQKEARTDPVVKAVTEVFGGRLQVPPRFQIQSEGERRVGVLQLVPELPSQRLIRDVGRFVWQQAPSRFDDLVVLLKEDMEDEGKTVPIPRPFLVRGRMPRSGPRPKLKPKPKPKPKPATKPATRPAQPPSK
jgi:hypothetical protein